MKLQNKQSHRDSKLYRLDLGDGKDVELKECPRSKLRKQCIKYLGPVCDQKFDYLVPYFFSEDKIFFI